MLITFDKFIIKAVSIVMCLRNVLRKYKLNLLLVRCYFFLPEIQTLLFCLFHPSVEGHLKTELGLVSGVQSVMLFTLCPTLRDWPKLSCIWCCTCLIYNNSPQIYLTFIIDCMNNNKMFTGLPSWSDAYQKLYDCIFLKLEPLTNELLLTFILTICQSYSWFQMFDVL